MTDNHLNDGNYINSIIDLTNTGPVFDSRSYNGLKCSVDGLKQLLYRKLMIGNFAFATAHKIKLHVQKYCLSKRNS